MYVKLAPGYEKEDEKTGVPLVIMRLCKRFYGLRQSPNHWNSTFDTYVMKIGFKSQKKLAPASKSKTDDDSITNSTANTSQKPDVIHTLHVDDLMLTGSVKAVLTMLKFKLMSRFLQRTLKKSR